MITFPTPATETKLVALADLKAELGVTGSGSDGQLNVLIDAATARIQNICSRINFGSATAQETFYRAPGRCRPLWLSHAPVASVSSVTENGDALAAGDYELEDGRKLWRKDGDSRISWPQVKLVVTYAGGYALPDACPDDLQRVGINLVREMWFSLQRDPLVKAEAIPGVLSQDYWVGEVAGRTGGLSEGDAAILANYTHYSFG